MRRGPEAADAVFNEGQSVSGFLFGFVFSGGFRGRARGRRGGGSGGCAGGSDYRRRLDNAGSAKSSGHALGDPAAISAATGRRSRTPAGRTAGGVVQ